MPDAPKKTASTTTTSPLLLNSLRVLRLEVTTRDAGGEAMPHRAIKTTFGYRKHPDRHAYMVSLDLSVSWPKNAYFKDAAVQLQAVYELPPDYTDDQARVFFPVVCSVNLVGFARTILIQATSLAEPGPYMLPFINVNEAIKAAMQDFSATTSAGDGDGVEPNAGDGSVKIDL